MNERALSLFPSIYFDISRSGITKELTPEQQRSVFLLNQLVFISCLVNFACFIFYFSQDLFISALVNLLTGTVFSFIIYLNRLKKYRAARMLWVANVNLYIITINITEGFSAGEYLLFFLVFISITLIIRTYSNYKELAIIYIITGVSAFLCILFIPYETQFRSISPAAVRRIYNSCLAICMIATIFVSFLVLRTNKEKETLILEEQNPGEAIYNTSSICGNRIPCIDEVKSGNLQQFEGIKMLVAEDNPINMAIVKRILTKWGIETTGAVNGREAVEKFEPGKYDLLLLDLEMPEMDGVSALKEIRKFDPQVPIVAFTAAIYENIQKDLKEKGFNDYIHKPFHPEDLHSKIFSLTVANKRA
ncbi:MAG: response regulator [Chitinophagaceae bacterium]